jgi:hypothetical protein
MGFRAQYDKKITGDLTEPIFVTVNQFSTTKEGNRT